MKSLVTLNIHWESAKEKLRMSGKNIKFSRRDFKNILKADDSKDEKYCPQNIHIGKVLRQTLEELF